MINATNHDGVASAGPIPGCGDFVVEERPEKIVREILAMTSSTGGR
jgi:hypothetical protein